VDGHAVVGSHVGFDDRSNRTRLGFVHDQRRFAQVHEERDEIFNCRSECSDNNTDNARVCARLTAVSSICLKCFRFYQHVKIRSVRNV